MVRCILICIFLMISDLDPFSKFTGQLLILFGNMFVQNFYPLINWHICYSDIELGELFVFWILIPYQICDFQMLLACWWVGDGGRRHCGLENPVVSEAASLGLYEGNKGTYYTDSPHWSRGTVFQIWTTALFSLDSVIKQCWHHPPHIPGEVARECRHQFLAALFLGLVPLCTNEGKNPDSLFPVPRSVTSALLLSKCSHCSSPMEYTSVGSATTKGWTYSGEAMASGLNTGFGKKSSSLCLSDLIDQQNFDSRKSRGLVQKTKSQPW